LSVAAVDHIIKMLSAVNEVFLDQSTLMDVASRVQLHGILMELCNNRVSLALVASRISGGLPMVMIAHATLPNSTRPILLFIMFPTVAKGVIQSAGVT
jgi:hypothetical protein